TVPKQYAFLAAKVFIGARLSTGMQFEGVDGDSAYYGTAIGLSGAGKGLAWRRVVEKILGPASVRDKGVKLFTDVDSGAVLGEAYMSSFPGKTKVGLWDRFYPEFSNLVEAEFLPDIDPLKAGTLLTKVYSMPFAGKMTMDEEAKAELESFWKSRPAEVRTKSR